MKQGSRSYLALLGSLLMVVCMCGCGGGGGGGGGTAEAAVTDSDPFLQNIAYTPRYSYETGGAATVYCESDEAVLSGGCLCADPDLEYFGTIMAATPLPDLNGYTCICMPQSTTQAINPALATAICSKGVFADAVVSVTGESFDGGEDARMGGDVIDSMLHKMIEMKKQ